MTLAEDSPVVFWGCDQIIGCTENDQTGHPVLYVYPDVAQLLERLSRRARCGLIASGPEWTAPLISTLLESASVAPLFAPKLLQSIRGPFSTESLALAVRSARPAQICVFASIDHVRRAAAIEAGMRAVPHRDLVEEALSGELLTYVRITARNMNEPVDSLLRDIALIPSYRAKTVPNTLYGVTSLRIAKALSKEQGYEVEQFGRANEPAHTELYLVRDCLDGSSGAVAFRQRISKEVPTFREVDDGFLLALGPEQAITDFHPPRRSHGHTILLRPTRALLSDTECELPVLATKRLISPADADVIKKELDGGLIATYLWPWTGRGPLPDTTPPQFIASRYVYARDSQNERVASALAAAMGQILGESNIWTPADGGKTLYVEGRISGSDPREIVIVGAHLDSIALGALGKPADKAPGVDDDATGIAAVLAAAKVLRKLSDGTRPRRGIRFVLFNAEEIGFLGSQAYVTALQAKPVRPVAMIQMDMIGLGTAGSDDEYEIHAPGPDDFSDLSDCVWKRIDQLVELIKANGGQVNGLNVEIFPSSGKSTDPMAWRSDHCSFLVYGHWPACLVCENAFGPNCKDLEDCNKVYHTEQDLDAHPEYVAAIARAVAATIWVIAN